MAGPRVSAILRHIHRLADRPAEQTDGQLLQRFVGQRDEAAFAALLRRHGRLVWSVCRQRLHHEQDAEDAFQATFLILARRAATIRKTESVASWLHGVAYRIARKAVTMTANRRRRERVSALAAAGSPDRAAPDLADLAARELQAILDEELERLPAKCRAAFILCCLEGRSRKEAAAELGWKEGTLSCRIAQARQLLQNRLRRRGVTLSAALTAGVLWGLPAPAALLDATRTAASLVAAGRVVSEATTAAVAALVHSGLRTVAGAKAKLTIVLALTGILTGGLVLAGSVGILRQQLAGTEPIAQKATQSAAATWTDAYGDPLPPDALMRLGTNRLRSDYSTLCVAFTRDGKTVFTSDSKPVYTPKSLGTVVRWDVATGRPLRRLQTSLGPIHALAVSPNGKTLAAGGLGEIALLDIGTGLQTAKGPVNSNKLNMENRIVGLAFSPDGKTLAVRDQGRAAYLWDVGTASVVHRLAGHQGRNLTAIAFCPDGKLVASGALGDPMVRLWDPGTGKGVRQIKATQQHDVLSLAFSPDGKELAVGCTGDPVRFWDPATGKRLRDADDHLDAWWATLPSELCYYPDGKKLAGIAGFRLVVWDTATGKLLFLGEDDPLPHNKYGLIVAPDGKTVAASPDWRGGPHTIELWDSATGKRRHHFQGHREGVNALAFTADGRSLCSAASALIIWDPHTGKERRRIEGAYRTLTLSADGRFLVAPAHEPATAPVPEGPDDAVGFWELATGGEVRRIKGHTTTLTSILLSADGKTLAWSSVEGKKTIFIYNAESGTERRVINLDRWPHPLTLSPDGQTVAAGGFLDGAVRLWDTATGKERPRVGIPPYLHPDTIAFSPDGRLLATGGSEFGRSEFACLWDPATGKLLHRFDSLGQRIIALAFSPDGRTLATVGSARRAQLWEVTTGRERASFTGHQGRIVAVAFSPDGARLATGSKDTTILVWDVASWGATSPATEVRLSAREIDSLLTDLASDDARKAFAAVWKLARSPGTVAQLRTRIQPAEAAAHEQLARWVADLDSEAFADRDKASRELENQAELAEPTLRKALATDLSPEVRRRIEALLSKLQGPVTSAGTLRSIRAIEVLEHMGTPEARQLLRELAEGAPGARLTREAKAALERLGKRTAP